MPPNFSASHGPSPTYIITAGFPFVVIHSGSTDAFGACQRGGKGLRGIVAALATVAACVASIGFAHVPAHDGHPCNELLDSLAKWASQPEARRLAPTTTLYDLLGVTQHDTGTTAAVHWAPLALSGIASPEYPSAHGDLLHMPLPFTTPDPHKIFPPIKWPDPRSLRTSNSQNDERTICLAANVQTLTHTNATRTR